MGNLASNPTVVGYLTFIGVQVLVTLGALRFATAWIDRRVDERINAWSYSDASAFGKHRLDENAHEPMRIRMGEALSVEFEKLREEMRVQNRNHRDEVQNLTDIVKPIIALHAKMFDTMAAQMRRQPPTEP